MRAGPLGVLYGLDSVRLGSIARDQAVVTHRDPRAIAGAVAVAGAVALAARSGPLDARSAMNELNEWVRPYDHSVAGVIAQVADWIALPPAEAAARVAALADPPRRSGRGVSPFVTPSVAWSLYAFLRSPDDYRETLCTAIEVGGDTDTLAAMAGAMSGARLGLAGVPPEVVDRLTDRGLWSGTDLARLARECAGVLGGL